MKTITALAAMMLLYACGSEPSNGSEAVAAAANDTPTAPAEEKTRVEELAGTGGSSVSASHRDRSRQ